jgi:type II secretory pathway pseudopilin PulG
MHRGFIKGFTLAELSISIGIIMVLSVATLLGFARISVRARNANRVAIVEGYKQALELYYRDHRHYPGPDGCTPGAGSTDDHGFVPRSVDVNGICTSTSLSGDLAYADAAAGGFLHELYEEGYFDKEEWMDPLGKPSEFDTPYNCRYIVKASELNSSLPGDCDIQSYYLHCGVEDDYPSAKNDGGFHDNLYEVWGDPDGKPWLCIIDIPPA